MREGRWGWGSRSQKGVRADELTLYMEGSGVWLRENCCCDNGLNYKEVWMTSGWRPGDRGATSERQTRTLSTSTAFADLLMPHLWSKSLHFCFPSCLGRLFSFVLKTCVRSWQYVSTSLYSESPIESLAMKRLSSFLDSKECQISNLRYTHGSNPSRKGSKLSQKG